jgi:hypothetical protein
MHEHGLLPGARQDGLLVETLGEELLLYDQNSHTAHCLSPIAACVWRHCDGEHDVTELAVLAGVSETLVGDALHELREKDLLAAEPALMQSSVPGVSRREAIIRVARYSAAAAAVPLIVSATAATPAMASSGVPKCGTAVTNSSCCVCQLSNGVECLAAETPELTESECKETCEHIGGILLEFKAKRGCV